MDRLHADKKCRRNLQVVRKVKINKNICTSHMQTKNTKEIHKLCAKWKSAKRSAEVTCEQKYLRNWQVVCKVKEKRKYMHKLHAAKKLQNKFSRRGQRENQEKICTGNMQTKNSRKNLQVVCKVVVNKKICTS